MASLVVVDYGAGNLTSVHNALDYLGVSNEVTSDPAVIAAADRVVFPGVGAAGSAMETLRRTGLGGAVRSAVLAGKPVLGICIGCQIITEFSEEDGGVPCLGLLPGRAVRFRSEPGLKIPHMGWNQVHFTQPHPLLAGVDSGCEFYFVHSYYPQVETALTFATTTYGSQQFSCVIGRDNLVATQFHTEKSGEAGLRLLKNFSQWSV